MQFNVNCKSSRQVAIFIIKEFRSSLNNLAEFAINVKPSWIIFYFNSQAATFLQRPSNEFLLTTWAFKKKQVNITGSLTKGL